MIRSPVLHAFAVVSFHACTRQCLPKILTMLWMTQSSTSPRKSVPVCSSHASVWHDEAVCEHRMIWRQGLVLIRLLTSS